ncbi:MAG: peptidylprolyl isomerase [Armatimonadetes bacterium]|nr:peptidylprolyl isomerase [Armatimonadota bacterium]MDE2206698.1 peptidylprolyl isomerase [Armatimonadota bacterium]
MRYALNLHVASFGLATLLLAASAGTLQAAPPARSTANPQLTMVIAKRGTIQIELFPTAAPKTVAHILALVKRHFYNGIRFHRVVPGFVAQGGDPGTRKLTRQQVNDPAVVASHNIGDGGSGTTVPLEATMPHTRGTLGLARSNDPTSGDSQFFFNLVDNHRLDSQYCVFGKILKGLKVMDSIKQGDRIVSLTLTKQSKATKPARKSTAHHK